MYISINKEWFDKNRKKLDDESDDKDCFVISTEDTEAQLGELDNDNKLWVSETISKNNETIVYCSLDYTPKTETVVALVENSIDDIKGDALAKIIELVVKKLNKFKSLIESIRGL